ncbi:hypothetical protein GUITHDRAFT_150435 [Guillardia theta CCMP2712]|uniref:Uncharacterized protein n=1 Tax=Guillardia theta (strain CCMP2712) TaxID=905079 RepID=L1JWU4_GUITC|nr:hypothetical protein GUITHDRAFT_150435 [Guillardia theta CCMP2712]EKX52784.1 hypothetical protein GUITHDRAFT_150435 [Guillardia theta CCMP2712]|eukprot:XP_005839764.1 hypothetical protein GUITHDRAFT_150435 [Guillardia theta CCMP2712]
MCPQMTPNFSHSRAKHDSMVTLEEFPLPSPPDRVSSAPDHMLQLSTSPPFSWFNQIFSRHSDQPPPPDAKDGEVVKEFTRVPGSL